MQKKPNKRMSRKKRFALERKKIAKERIEILFSRIKKDPTGKYASRYAKLIFSISRKYRIPKPKNFVKNCCPRCFRYSVSGKNVKIRIKNGKQVRICLCGKSF